MHEAWEESGIEKPADGGSQMLAVSASAGVARRETPSAPGYTPVSESSELAALIVQYLNIILKRRWVIVSVALAVVSLGILKALMSAPRYTSTVQIQIDREAAKVVENGSTVPREEGGADFMKTQVELLKSRAMADRVVSQLELQNDPTFFNGGASAVSLIAALFRPAATGMPAPARLKAQAVKIVSANVEIKPVTGSRLVDVSYEDISAIRAQKVANAYAEAFVASTVDKRFQANSYAKTFLEDQLKQVKSRLEESEQAALDFAEREKIVEVNDKASVAENNLAAANTAVGQLISDRIKSEELWQQAEKASVINIPQLLSNRVIEDLRAHRKDLETEYQEKLESFKPGYSAMVQISNKLKEIDKQLTAETATIRNSLRAAYEAALNHENEMKRRVGELREEVLNLQKKSIQYNILRREAETNRSLYNSLLQRYKEVDIAVGAGTNNVFIVDPAVLPEAPSSPNLPRTILLSLILGLALGVATAYTLELLDDRIRVPEEIEQLSGLPALGVIPRISEEGMKKALEDPRSILGEAHRSLATALQFATETGLPRSVAITSAGPSEGKSTTALAISRYFAALGLKVLLIDADLRKPSLHLKLGKGNSIGISNYLTGNAGPPELLQKTDHPNLAFMASGPLPQNAADLLGGSRIFSLVSIGSKVFDLIIIDCPPLMGLADAQLLASAAAATVFVVGAGQHRKGTIRSGLRRLTLAPISVVGAVLTKFDSKAAGYGYAYGYSGYGGYGYGYRYAYGSGHIGEKEFAAKAIDSVGSENSPAKTGLQQ